MCCGAKRRPRACEEAQVECGTRHNQLWRQGYPKQRARHRRRARILTKVPRLMPDPLIGPTAHIHIHWQTRTVKMHSRGTNDGASYRGRLRTEADPPVMMDIVPLVSRQAYLLWNLDRRLCQSSTPHLSQPGCGTALENSSQVDIRHYKWSCARLKQFYAARCSSNQTSTSRGSNRLSVIVPKPFQTAPDKAEES